RAGKHGEARTLVIAGQRIVLVDEQLRRALEHVARADDVAEFGGEIGHDANLNGDGRQATGDRRSGEGRRYKRRWATGRTATGDGTNGDGRRVRGDLAK